jgi:hypothetical protein
MKARAKSENYYRNKSLSIVNKLQEKDQQYYNLMQQQRASDNDKYIQHQRQ